jgi:hypothetical protein
MADIIDRIKNLLHLSRNNDSVEEAALAATRAQELMFRYQIQESDIVTSEEERKPEALVEESIDSKDKKRNVWKSCLAYAVAKGFGATMYYTHAGGTSRFQIFGLESSVQTVKYMYSSLLNEIERLCEEGWKAHGKEQRQSPRTWRNNFRLGAVNTIRQRLENQRQAQNVEVRERVAEAKRAAKPQSTALALYQTNEERVEAGYEELRKKHNLRKRRTHSRHNPTAYQRGSEAGANVSLGGGRGLNAPAKGIES